MSDLEEAYREMIRRIITGEPLTLTDDRYRVEQTPTTGLNAVFGRLKTDESDEEIAQALEEIS